MLTIRQAYIVFLSLLIFFMLHILLKLCSQLKDVSTDLFSVLSQKRMMHIFPFWRTLQVEHELSLCECISGTAKPARMLPGSSSVGKGSPRPRLGHVPATSSWQGPAQASAPLAGWYLVILRTWVMLSFSIQVKCMSVDFWTFSLLGNFRSRLWWLVKEGYS